MCGGVCVCVSCCQTQTELLQCVSSWRIGTERLCFIHQTASCFISAPVLELIYLTSCAHDLQILHSVLTPCLFFTHKKLN